MYVIDVWVSRLGPTPSAARLPPGRMPAAPDAAIAAAGRNPQAGAFWYPYSGCDAGGDESARLREDVALAGI